MNLDRRNVEYLLGRLEKIGAAISEQDKFLFQAYTLSRGDTKLLIDCAAAFVRLAATEVSMRAIDQDRNDPLRALARLIERDPTFLVNKPKLTVV